MVELVDTYVSGAYVGRHGGSSPLLSIFLLFIFLSNYYYCNSFAFSELPYFVSGASPRTPTYFFLPAKKVGKKASRLTSQFQIIPHFVSVLVKFEAEPNFWFINTWNFKIIVCIKSFFNPKICLILMFIKIYSYCIYMINLMRWIDDI